MVMVMVMVMMEIQREKINEYDVHYIILLSFSCPSSILIVKERRLTMMKKHRSFLLDESFDNSTKLLVLTDETNELFLISEAHVVQLTKHFPLLLRQGFG